MSQHETPLDSVGDKIAEARDAEAHLETVMPNAIQPDDDAYDGMSGNSTGAVAEADPDAETTDRREAQTAEETVTEQVQDEVLQDDPHRSSDTDRRM